MRRSIGPLEGALVNDTLSTGVPARTRRRKILNRFRPDPFTLALLAVVTLASFLPVDGAPAHYFATATKLAVALLFFMHGARLSREAVITGATHWRLHALVTTATFLLFPVLGLLIVKALPGLLGPGLVTGILFLCCLPSTVQSSIAFTSMAGGNVPAAICSATFSNLAGILITPLEIGLLLSTQGGGANLDAIQSIVVQLLLPFLAGQLSRPLLADWAARHRRLLMFTDRGSILMVVYGAFSEAVVTGLWRDTPWVSLLTMIAVNIVLLVLVLAITAQASRRLGFNRADRIAIVFCGSKKSLASGAPMANVLFPPATVGLAVLPIMLFHQIQLMACSWLAQRYAQELQPSTETA